MPYRLCYEGSSSVGIESSKGRQERPSGALAGFIVFQPLAEKMVSEEGRTGSTNMAWEAGVSRGGIPLSTGSPA